MPYKGIKFLTDSDGPLRAVLINPDYVATVEEDMARPAQICHITLATGHYYRIQEPAETANRRLQYGQ